MFSGCESMKQFDGIVNDDTGYALTYMNNMFSNCTQMKICNFHSDSANNLIYCSEAFNNCYSLQYMGAPWLFENCTEARCMF